MKNIAANIMLFHRRAGHVRINLLQYNTELKNVPSKNVSGSNCNKT